MGVAYDGIASALITESEHGIWKAGRRCPDIVLHPRDHAGEIRLYSTVIYGRFCVLSIGTTFNTDGWPKLPIPLARYEILGVDQDGQTPDSEIEERLAFTSPEVCPHEQFLVVVRPDMYVGYAGSKEGAVCYLAKTVLGLGD